MPPRAPGARARCPRPGCPRGTRRGPRSPRRAPRSPPRRRSRPRAASAESDSPTLGGITASPSRVVASAAASSSSPSTSLASAAAYRPIGLSERAAPASSAQPASSRAPSRSPAIRRDFIAPMGRPQLPGGASGQLLRYVSAARTSHSFASSRRPTMSSERPAAHAAFPIRVSWRWRSSASSGRRAAPSS